MLLKRSLIELLKEHDITATEHHLIMVILKAKVFWELFNHLLEILEPRFGNPFWE